MKYIFLTMLFVGLSCKSTKNATIKEIETLGSKFKVEKIENSAIALKVKPTLVFDFEKNTVSGNAGCNNYSGLIIRKDNQLKFENLVATKMYCGNMKIEKEFLKKLQSTTSFAVKDSQFLLYDKNNDLVFTCKVTD